MQKNLVNPHWFPPVGSGPYIITAVNSGKSIIYTKNPDYWARNLPVQRGFFNFDTIQVDYYRSALTRFEAFKKGLFDIYPENSPSKWRTVYNFPAVQDGQIIKDEFEIKTPSGMLGICI